MNTAVLPAAATSPGTPSRSPRRAAPYIPAGPAALLVTVVAALTLGAALTSFAAISRRGKSPA